MTWIFGEPSEDDFSEVEVRLSVAGGGETALELEHTATVDPQRWAEFGPGAVGVGWDSVLLGLGLHLRDGGSLEDPEAWARSAEGRQFMTGSSKAWGAALEAAGDTIDIAAAVENTTKFYVPDNDQWTLVDESVYARRDAGSSITVLSVGGPTMLGCCSRTSPRRRPRWRPRRGVKPRPTCSPAACAGSGRSRPRP